MKTLRFWRQQTVQNKLKGKIFNAQEVQAIISGSKVMFREVIKPQPEQPIDFPDAYFDCYNKGNQWNWWTKDNKQLFDQIVKCPYQVGQKIFCKESFWTAGGKIVYKADHESYKPISPWRRAMKQEHSRLTLLIKEIRVEKLADISEEDAIKEGVMNDLRIVHYHPVEYFRQHWNAAHKKPEEKFEASPFVWCITFEIINN